jgi:hypothetical protein
VDPHILVGLASDGMFDHLVNDGGVGHIFACWESLLRLTKSDGVLIAG